MVSQKFIISYVLLSVHSKFLFLHELVILIIKFLYYLYLRQMFYLNLCLIAHEISPHQDKEISYLSILFYI